MKKLNLGCGPRWKKEGWTGFDHSQEGFFAAEAWRLPYADQTFDIVFSSHMIEHIPVQRLEHTFSEINRILKPGGIFRFLTPDFLKICKAYVENDTKTMQDFIIEDGSGVPKTLGLAQAVIGFAYGPGFDNILLSSRGDEITACMGHVSMLDFQIASGLLAQYGFTDIKHAKFCESEIPEMQEPWHLEGEKPVWVQPLDFPAASLSTMPQPATAGFDRDPLISLIVECKKSTFVPFSEVAPILFKGPYRDMRHSKRLTLIRAMTGVARYINGILYYVNGLFRRKR